MERAPQCLQWDDDMNAVTYSSPGFESKRALSQGIIDNPERWIGHHHCGAPKISWTEKTIETEARLLPT